MIGGLFDIEYTLRDLDKGGDPLVRLKSAVDWELFRADLNRVREKERKSNAGARPYDVVLMFMILILQSLYNLSDAATEYQIRDRLSFRRFLGIGFDARVPDENTIRNFREALKDMDLVEPLFTRFDAHLRMCGFEARKGQIVDASIVQAPRQRNTREENERIKNGETIEEWDEPKARQKDTDATWTKRRGKDYYGYKNHIQIDVKYKFIRNYITTDAALHDSNIFTELLDPENTNADVYADSAYRSAATMRELPELGYRPHIQRKGARNRPLDDRAKEANRKRAKVRARVEHIFGAQYMRAGGDMLIRTIGMARAKVKIGLRNLTYNIERLAILQTAN